MTEVDGAFVEFPSGRVVDPAGWLREPFEGYLAGFLSYEFGWELLDVRAARTLWRGPMLWVGRFLDRRASSFAGEDGGIGAIEPRVSAEAYMAAVEASVREIYAGELFEVNYTARWQSTWSGDPAGLFLRMAQVSTGDYFGLLESEDFAIASVSPEAFVSVADGRVETRPIKGTAARSSDPIEDDASRDWLRSSAKDRAENVMIVDLMRNDLTRVCQLGTVHVSGLCEVESFAGVHHLVSTVRGQLRQGMHPMDVLLACFPAGSITGAPKLRAMELAAELEVGARGAYTGSMFVATAESLESSVLIRTASMFREAANWSVEYGAGGAVVSSSSPKVEWEEALTKCGPLTRVGRDGGDRG